MKSAGGIVYLTPDEMRVIDEQATHDFGIDVLSLMENAGRQTANLARMMLGGDAAGKKVACLIGKGNNGGDGLVAARHLHNWGADVILVLGAPRDEFKGVPARQLATAETLGLPLFESGERLAGKDLVIDALLGYSSQGAPRGTVADLITTGNLSMAPILALDIPSGLDPTTGEASEPCIRAKATITLGFPKQGFLNPGARSYIGSLYLCDISLPRQIYQVHGEMYRVFATESIVSIPLPS